VEPIFASRAQSLKAIKIPKIVNATAIIKLPVTNIALGLEAPLLNKQSAKKPHALPNQTIIFLTIDPSQNSITFKLNIK
jgi:hypothetical protein